MLWGSLIGSMEGRGARAPASEELGGGFRWSRTDAGGAADDRDRRDRGEQREAGAAEHQLHAARQRRDLVVVGLLWHHRGLAVGVRDRLDQRGGGGVADRLPRRDEHLVARGGGDRLLALAIERAADWIPEREAAPDARAGAAKPLAGDRRRQRAQRHVDEGRGGAAAGGSPSAVAAAWSGAAAGAGSAATAARCI